MKRQALVFASVFLVLAAIAGCGPAPVRNDNPAAPVILSVEMIDASICGTTFSSPEIKWVTNAPTSGCLLFGPTSGYGGIITSDAACATVHVVTIESFNGNPIYFMVSANNGAVNSRGYQAHLDVFGSSECGDTYMDVLTPAVNFGSMPAMLCSGDTAHTMKMLIKFDVSSITSEARVIKSNLELFCNFATDSTLVCYPVAKDWKELEADWIIYNFSPGATWALPGTTSEGTSRDYMMPPVDAIVIGPALYTGWLTWEVTSAMTYWKDYPLYNFGLIFVNKTHLTSSNANFYTAQASFDWPKFSVLYMR